MAITISGLGFSTTNAYAAWSEWGDILYSYDGPWQVALLRKLDGDQTAVMYAGQYMQAYRPLNGGLDVFTLVMQHDGNLVLYRYINNNLSVLWASHTMNSGAHRLEMQADGNLVLYRPDNTPVWASNTVGHSSLPNNQNTLILQTDGNLVMYRQAHAVVGGAIKKVYDVVPWATGTNIY